MIRAAALSLVLALAPASTWAQDAATSAAMALAQAADDLAVAKSARDRVSALTKTIKAYEAGLSAMRVELRSAALREASIQAAFERESGTLSTLLGALQSMSTSPETLVLLHPSGPVETARAGMILSDVAPAIRQKVAGLELQLQELATLRALQNDAVQVLADGLAGVQEARIALSQAISERTALPDRSATDEAALLALVEGAETLQNFASGLVTEPTPNSGAVARGFVEAKGTLPLPAQGVPIRGFDQPDAAGVARPGILLATRPGALITSPWPATIRYAGPLLDYGNVIIVEPEAGYLLVMAGLNEVFGTVGDIAEAGAPLGQMGGTLPQAQDILIAARNGGGQDRTETLYIELREGETPVNPGQWFQSAQQ